MVCQNRFHGMKDPWKEGLRCKGTGTLAITSGLNSMLRSKQLPLGGYYCSATPHLAVVPMYDQMHSKGSESHDKKPQLEDCFSGKK